jgi:hypothetical protein
MTMACIPTSFVAGFTYFIIVYCIAFAFGTIRVFFVVPSLGVRYAELLEMPILTLAFIPPARFVERKFALPTNDIWLRLKAGLFALAFTLGMEWVMFWARSKQMGTTIMEEVAGKDRVTGIAFLVTLGVFAVVPTLLPVVDGWHGAPERKTK